jgi:3-oxoadipate enol-lactonase
MNFDWRAQLQTIKVPTLCMCGSEDPSGGPLEARRIASLIPGARYEEITRAHHLPNVERSEVFNKLLLDWLAAHRG